MDEALAELNGRLAGRGIHARVYVHDGMTAVMIHRDGDTAATVDEALEDGPDVVGELAAQIAAERDLPEDWLSRLGAEPPRANARRRLTICERSLQLALIVHENALSAFWVVFSVCGAGLSAWRDPVGVVWRCWGGRGAGVGP
ncbi:hypothetical protein [Candidatus Poriferisodalis sp.]|uniref:hypothetical protein n=1 Tax=Candidatus Poriferisodalis sp. TaxID=3101277 RepID=UPI003B5236D4